MDTSELKNIKATITTGKYKEGNYRNNLAKALNGTIEVPVPIGYIDVVTTDSIIEVKLIDEWKAALGQVIVYSIFYPDHKRKLHLLYAPNANINRYKILLEYVLTKLKVEVEFELLQETDYVEKDLYSHRTKLVKDNPTLSNIELAKLMKSYESDKRLKSFEMWIVRNRELIDPKYNGGRLKKVSRQEILRENFHLSNIEIARLIQEQEPTLKIKSLEMWVSRNREI